MKEKLGLVLEGVEHDSYPQKSWIVAGHKPDVIAKDVAKELNYLGDAKTPEDVGTQDTRDQLLAWSKVKMADGKSKGVLVPISVAVPKVAYDKLVTALSQWGLKDRVKPITYA